METLNLLLDGFGIALTLDNFILALIGCVLGTIFGALPGLGPANGVAILIPLSFSLGLSAASSMILLASVYYGAMYGGRISSIMDIKTRDGNKKRYGGKFSATSFGSKILFEGPLIKKGGNLGAKEIKIGINFFK